MGPLPTLSELIAGDVQFLMYRDGNLWYMTANGYSFPVPVADATAGTFRARDKGIFFMRWIRKFLEDLKREVEGTSAV